MNIEWKNKISESNKHAKKNSKPVEEITTGMVFGSAHLAHVHFGITTFQVMYSISNNCVIMSKNGIEYRFKYVSVQ